MINWTIYKLETWVLFAGRQVQTRLLSSKPDLSAFRNNSAYFHIFGLKSRGSTLVVIFLAKIFLVLYGLLSR